MATPWLDDVYAPFAFTNILGYPSDMSGISLVRLSHFYDDDVVNNEKPSKVS